MTISPESVEYLLAIWRNFVSWAWLPAAWAVHFFALWCIFREHSKGIAK